MLFVLCAACASSDLKYAVIVDAGSSGTRFSLYQWDASDATPNPIIVPGTPSRFTFSIPLAQAATNSSVIPDIFSQIITLSAPHLPTASYESTRVFVSATAGMRLLPLDSQKAIMSDVYYYLKENSPFHIRKQDIRVIAGYEEGIFGWVAVMHLLNLFPDGQFPGFSEMGGASTQIAYLLTDQGTASQPDIYDVSVLSKTYRLFAHSYLGYGTDRASASITTACDDHQDPCMTAGYTFSYNNETYIGTGNVDKCLAAIDTVLLADPAFAQVNLAPFSFKELYGISAYATLVEFLELPENVTMDELWKASLDFMRLNWSEASALHPGNPYLSVYFFDCCYVYQLLTKGFKIGDRNVTFPSKINGRSIDYTIGLIVASVWGIDIEEKGKLSLTVLIVVVVVLAVALVPLFVVYLRPRRDEDEKSYLIVP
jgi:Golgi nucleoside diphosphatase